MSSAAASRSSPQELLSRRSFRLRHSVWLLGPILGLGMLTWASFLYIGARARRWYWVAAGAGYGAATAVTFYFVDGTEGPNGQQNDWTGGAIIAIWIAGIVHAMLVNRSWLRWRAEHRTPWYAAGGPQLAPPPPVPPTTPPTSAPSSALPPELAAVDVDPGRYWARPRDVRPLDVHTAEVRTAEVRTAEARTAEIPTAARPGAAQRLDVNTAQPHELGALPGMTPERVCRVLQERRARGGFAGVAEFADATGLRPHEHYRIRALVTCSPQPRPTPPPGGGRVLDY